MINYQILIICLFVVGLCTELIPIPVGVLMRPVFLGLCQRVYFAEKLGL